MPPFNVDFVVPWVDGSDPVWIAKKNKYSTGGTTEADLNSDERYREFGTLKNWVDRVEKYAPWVHRVFIITDNQDLGFELPNEKYKQINHSDYIAAEYLPLFNSNPILLNVDRIEGLSEHFVMFNDDMILNNPVDYDDFFTKEGTPIDVGAMNVMSPSIPFHHIILNNLTYVNSAFNKKDMVKKNFFKYVNYKYGIHMMKTLLALPWNKFTGWHDEHITISYLKSTFVDVHNRFPNMRHEQSLHKFRSSDDVGDWIMRYWQLAAGNFHPREIGKLGRFVVIQPGIDQTDLKNALESDAKVICVNDEKMNETEAALARKTVVDLLGEI